MPLETRDLASFAVLAELLHFGRAAARLHVSQPALSKRIKSLEEKIGGPLLLRNRRGVSLTAAGATFYKDARRILRDIDTAFEAAQGASSGELGKLRLGVGMSTVHSLVPRALLKFREARPGVEIEVADMATIRQIEALISGRLDVGFVRLPVKHPQLAIRKVLTERLTIATSAKFAGPVTMKGIQEQAFILIDRGVSAAYHDHCISLCDRSGFAPRIVYEANDMFTILNLVSAGIGVSLVPTAARAMHVTGVKFATLRSKEAEWDIGMAWNRKSESEIIRKFAEIVLPVHSQP
ncbi:MAG: LysR family transcriptional regulator [Terriglobales bacterium]|jgi:DNA-binding transcriptional LysR family regulator|nr:LysR family transcriptional regulator [Terriglobales bacterium]